MAEIQIAVPVTPLLTSSHSQSQSGSASASASATSPGTETKVEKDQPPYSLSDEINTATRSPHAHLNRQILSLLPLALPPNTSNPALYRLGLTHIQPIYEAFEASWSIILSQSQNIRPSILHLLQNLHLPSLLRSSSLANDVLSLTPKTQNGGPEPATIPSPILQEFITRIRDNIEEKPHLLLAYTWIFYMALFSGGRYLRLTLKEAGEEFWSSPSDQINSTIKSTTNPTPKSDSDANPETPTHHPRHKPGPDTTSPLPGLSFFSFPTPTDGEDLKLSFKSNIQLASTILTPVERAEIIQESIQIFESMGHVVEELEIGCAELCLSSGRWFGGDGTNDSKSHDDTDADTTDIQPGRRISGCPGRSTTKGGLEKSRNSIFVTHDRLHSRKKPAAPQSFFSQSMNFISNAFFSSSSGSGSGSGSRGQVQFKPEKGGDLEVLVEQKQKEKWRGEIKEMVGRNIIAPLFIITFLLLWWWFRFS